MRSSAGNSWPLTSMDLGREANMGAHRDDARSWECWKFHSSGFTIGCTSDVLLQLKHA